MVTVTSAQAHKLLNKLNEDFEYLARKENQSCVFNAAVGEDIESVRPEYNYAETQATLEEIRTKVRKIKHAINVFNTTTVIPEVGITIDEALVLIPMLTKKKSRLNVMKSRLPKKRVEGGYRSGGIIDYEIVNYDIKAVEADYDEVSVYLAKIQTALDLINGTVTFEIDVEV